VAKKPEARAAAEPRQDVAEQVASRRSAEPLRQFWRVDPNSAVVV